MSSNAMSSQGTAFNTMTARDLMRTDLVTLSPNATMKEAVITLSEYGVHGVPVVDAAGVLVGVLSLTDIVRHDRARDEGESGWTMPRGFESECVKEWMTPDVCQVSFDATLAEVCDCMARREIHRVFVEVEGGLTGVISALDVVAFLARESSKGEVKQ